MPTLLGYTSDGRMLTYDAQLYEFSIDGELAPFADVQMLDVRNWLRWRAPELRDWFRRIVPADLDACNKRARGTARSRARDDRPMICADAQAACGVAGSGAGDRKTSGSSVEPNSASQAAAAKSWLEYRSTDDSVASVDNQGIVRIRQAGRAEIYARRVNAGGPGPEMRVTTVVIDESVAEQSTAMCKAGKKAKKRQAQSTERVGDARAASDETAVQSADIPETSTCIRVSEASGVSTAAQVPETVVTQVPSQEPLVEQAPEAERASASELTLVTVEGQRVAGASVLKAYRTKAGRIVKAKEIQLVSQGGWPVVFKKAAGAPELDVTPDGKLVVPRGIPIGHYDAQVEAVPADGDNRCPIEVIRVSIKVQ